MIVDMFQTFAVGSKFLAFLKERKYRNPTDKSDTGFMYGMGTQDHYFQYISRPAIRRESEMHSA